MPRRTDSDPGAERARIANLRSALHAESARFIADGDRACVLARQRDDHDGSPPQRPVVMLLDGGEKGVEVDEKIAEPVHAFISHKVVPAMLAAQN